MENAAAFAAKIGDMKGVKEASLSRWNRAGVC